MERRELTKADLDKVRDIEGFPIGTDEDIIALSDAPYYTACPNPFIADFIAEHGHPYDPETDDYHREPFAADVSEGKNDPIYNAHSYHTKVPYKAIMRYILHYTDPGDIVLDGFCGTGMTGVAAQMCGCPDAETKYKLEHEMPDIRWGTRHAIVSDLAPAATFIASNYNSPVDIDVFRKEATRILNKCEEEFSWVYTTSFPTDCNILNGMENQRPIVSNIIWSSVLLCPHCGKEIIFYLDGVDDKGNVKSNFNCPHCNALISKTQAQRKTEVFHDEILDEYITRNNQVPVYKIFKFSGKKYFEPVDDYDFEILRRIDNISLKDFNIPTQKMMFRDGKWGDIYRSGYHTGFTHSHHFYTKRNLIVISAIYNEIMKYTDKRIRELLLFALTGSLPRLNRTNKWLPSLKMAPGPITGMLYIPSLYPELNVFNGFRNKVDDIEKFVSSSGFKQNSVVVSTQSSDSLQNIPSEKIDYIFIDPPFGDNIIYSESNFLWETWLNVFTNNTDEAIISDIQKKNISSYQELMRKCFQEFYRILKPGRWITIEFHNSKNSVWNSIQNALQNAKFIIADVRTLDKKQGSFKQVTTTGAVKQDLVISAYKPKEALRQAMAEAAGTEDTAWKFVRQHLEMLPVAPLKDGRIELVTERQAFLLFDRMVAYHVQNGLPVPIDAADFYKGLEDRFIQRDGMYFLSGQVNEYDLLRIKHDMEDAVQLGFIVSNEKTAVQWLYMQLAEPQTYQVLQPKFMQEVRAVDKYEKIPELAELLEENFLKNDKDEWYIPDVTKAGDVAKLREKRLLKEFEDYQKTKGKLKVFRIEAIRTGFKKLWDEKNYAAIVAVADRLPESVIQEDPNILMYSDLASTRV